MVNSTLCATAPSEAASNAGVAGAGVLLSFIITAGLALVLSAWIIIQEWRMKSEAKIARKLLLSFSDQQIITGIGIQSVALGETNSMIPYHFFLVWMLSSISTATHSAALLALIHDFKRDWVLRWLREFLIFVNLVLSVVLGTYILKDVTKKLAPTLPISCEWEANAATFTRTDTTISIVGTIGVIAGQCIVFTMAISYLHSTSAKWLNPARAVSFLVLTAIGTGATIRIIGLSQAFGKPSVILTDTAEKDWSFGQLLPVLLLLLPLISALEMYRGEMKVPSPVESDQRPLIVLGSQQPFQPNPFWGSRNRKAKSEEA